MCCLKCDTFPLKIEATEVENEEQEDNKEFILNMLQRVDYEALKGAAKDLSIEGLPDILPENVGENEAAMKSLHKLLLELQVKNGDLVCTNPQCGRRYPIKDRIPNMVLRDDEVMELKK
ncbi:predicted protein [Naegleria gruberi]|uniref:Predicted protein n=1 Tax=Naegleria gruberi TaxID=5762 RepID=D2VJD6_NAEGR|nr:uncharacterized protein NAEGRDRAFT_69000 [Naegleria gruberi]EFC42926.1 predicted protein [Naegleria gruberi]|eukprot:XP_002675670.1 predicted protein [Naegleria gruberi strain NEG-M]